MFVIAGGILLALFIVLVFVGLGAAIRSGFRFTMRNGRAVVAALIGIVTINGLFFLAGTVAKHLPEHPVYEARVAPPEGRDYSKVPRTLSVAPHGTGMGYYDGARFVCATECSEKW